MLSRRALQVVPSGLPAALALAACTLVATPARAQFGDFAGKAAASMGIKTGVSMACEKVKLPSCGEIADASVSLYEDDNEGAAKHARNAVDASPELCKPDTRGKINLLATAAAAANKDAKKKLAPLPKIFEVACNDAKSDPAKDTATTDSKDGSAAASGEPVAADDQPPTDSVRFLEDDEPKQLAAVLDVYAAEDAQAALMALNFHPAANEKLGGRLRTLLVQVNVATEKGLRLAAKKRPEAAAWLKRALAIDHNLAELGSQTTGKLLKAAEGFRPKPTKK